MAHTVRAQLMAKAKLEKIIFGGTYG